MQFLTRTVLCAVNLQTELITSAAEFSVPGALLAYSGSPVLCGPVSVSSVDPADLILTQVKTALQSHGYSTGSKHVLDFGHYDEAQADLAFNHSVFITAHGQGASNFVFSPECAVQLELFPNGGYNHMVRIERARVTRRPGQCMRAAVAVIFSRCIWTHHVTGSRLGPCCGCDIDRSRSSARPLSLVL